MIEANGINKSFDDHHVLKEINMTLNPGIINMIIGSSGSGKTVLLKTIVGLLEPDTGGIFFDNRNFTTMNQAERKLVRQEMGMLFQGAALFNSMTVEDNVAFPLKMFSGKTPEEISNQVDFCLERVNLENVHKLFPAEISGGMQKRVGIARAIVMNPKYLFYDEPNSGLDPKTSRVIDQLIKDITVEFKTTTLLNSHDMTSVFDIADHVIFIFEGQKWWEGHPSEIMTSNNSELLQMMEASGQQLG